MKFAQDSAGLCTRDGATLDVRTDWETEAGQQHCGKGPGGLGQWQLEYESALPWQPGEILELDYASHYFLFNFRLRQVINSCYEAHDYQSEYHSTKVR